MRDGELRASGPPSDFDNTILSGWVKCHRSTYWFLRGLDYIQTPVYFSWGRAWGAGLNKWHEPSDHSPEVRLAEAKIAAREEWDKDSPIESKSRPNDTWRNLEQCLEQYTSTYGPFEGWTQIQAEVGFLFPIPHTEINYGGAIDAYIDWNPYGTLPREDKTTGSYITDSYLHSWKHQSQVTGYWWGVRQLKAEEPFGVYMNITSKRPRNEPALRFQRDLQQRSEWMVNKFIHETVLLADDIRREWEPGQWNWIKTGERSPYACTGGAGLTACPFRRLCLQEMEPWEMEETYNFSQEFVWRDKWTPWEREGENE